MEKSQIDSPIPFVTANLAAFDIHLQVQLANELDKFEGMDPCKFNDLPD